MSMMDYFNGKISPMKNKDGEDDIAKDVAEKATKRLNCDVADKETKGTGVFRIDQEEIDDKNREVQEFELKFFQDALSLFEAEFHLPEDEVFQSADNGEGGGKVKGDSLSEMFRQIAAYDEKNDIESIKHKEVIVSLCHSKISGLEENFKALTRSYPELSSEHRQDAKLLERLGYASTKFDLAKASMSKIDFKASQKDEKTV